MGLFDKSYGEFNIPEGFTVTAHAGSNKTKENTLPSIKVALLSGADIVEFDLNVDEDGELVISHDAPKGEAPTFEDALLLVKAVEGIRINVDVKDTAKLDKAQEIILKHDMLDRVFYTGIMESYVPAVKEKSPLVPYYINCYPNVLEIGKEDYCDKLTDHVIELGGIGVNVQFLGASRELLKACRKKGLLLSVWTVKEKNDMKKYLALGPDNITTTKPTMLKNIILGKIR